MRKYFNSLVLAISMVLILGGCGTETSTRTVTETVVVYEEVETVIYTEFETVIYTDSNTSLPVYSLPPEITIVDVLTWDDRKGVAVTRNDTNITIYLVVMIDANTSSIMQTLDDLMKPVIGFYLVSGN